MSAPAPTLVDGSAPSASPGPTASPPPRDRRAAATRWSRRAVTIAVTLTMVAFPFLLTDTRSPLARENRAEHIRLYSNGIAQGADGLPQLVPTGASPAYLAGSRVLDPGPGDAVALAAAEDLAGDARAWLAAGSIPGAGGPYEDMVTDALLDMHALVLDDGASVAGWSARWRYVWPRDASFVAVALATTGHPDDALEILSFLQGVQHRNGSFEARYLPDGSGPPDDRGIQSDGTGWVLWATGAVLDTLDDDAARAAAAEDLRRMIDRSTERILRITDRTSSLPPASSDFWEVGEARLTLGTAAPLLSGLEAAVHLSRDLDDRRAATASRERAGDLRAAIEREFGPRFARYSDGRNLDAAAAFLLPPFQPTALPGALTAWRASVTAMARPAGGLAPGAGWKEDGISWTPQTSLYGLTAASAGDTDAAAEWLTWIDAHRTPSGAIPEKVLADGSPAAVAPLSWSAACVVLAVAALDDGR